MHFIVALIIGGIIGWIAGMVMRTEGGILWNILVGCFGSIVGRFLLGAFSGHGHLTRNPFDPRTVRCLHRRGRVAGDLQPRQAGFHPMRLG
jgi:uncharacterized membrane protein YeaQ/YmgE (transglycosylase-associated protein family)